MKTKLLFLSILMLLISVTNYAQTSASTSGIAVQGIARDDNNSAMANETITFNFKIYYKNPAEEVVFSVSESLTTDAFGVFSYILDVDPTTMSSFANHILFLKIEASGQLISDESFKHVPYAVSANNGVPTGSIMPYIGTTAPSGWVLCNGQSLTTVNGSGNLIALLGGNNVPDLQGMFLRGTGESPVNNQDGPNLMDTQGDENKAHTHGPGDLETDTEGDHNHTNGDYDRILKVTGFETSGGQGTSSNEVDVINSGTLQPSGAHEHMITSGETASSGGSETRPVNYGVNYIIKL